MKPIPEMTPLEIREAVATRVMGLSPVSKLYDPVRDMFVDVTAKRCANDRDVLAVKGPLDMWRELPAYESEIGPAFQVLDVWLALDRWHSYGLSSSSRVDGASGADRYTEYTAALYTGSMASGGGCATDESLPMAICLATLEAIGSAK